MTKLQEFCLKKRVLSILDAYCERHSERFDHMVTMGMVEGKLIAELTWPGFFMVAKAQRQRDVMAYLKAGLTNEQYMAIREVFTTSDDELPALREDDDVKLVSPIS